LAASARSITAAVPLWQNIRAAGQRQSEAHQPRCALEHATAYATVDRDVTHILEFVDYFDLTEVTRWDYQLSTTSLAFCMSQRANQAEAIYLLSFEVGLEYLEPIPIGRPRKWSRPKWMSSRIVVRRAEA